MKRMTKEDLALALEELLPLCEADPEIGHGDADDLLIKYINDQRVTEAFERLPRWYA